MIKEAVGIHVASRDRVKLMSAAMTAGMSSVQTIILAEKCGVSRGCALDYSRGRWKGDRIRNVGFPFETGWASSAFRDHCQFSTRPRRRQATVVGTTSSFLFSTIKHQDHPFLQHYSLAGTITGLLSLPLLRYLWTDPAMET